MKTTKERSSATHRSHSSLRPPLPLPTLSLQARRTRTLLLGSLHLLPLLEPLLRRRRRSLRRSSDDSLRIPHNSMKSPRRLPQCPIHHHLPTFPRILRSFGNSLPSSLDDDSDLLRNLLDLPLARSESFLGDLARFSKESLESTSTSLFLDS